MKKTISLLLCAAIFICCGNGIDDVFTVMDDAKFKEYCKTFDTNNDGKLSIDEAQAVISIHVYEKGIVSLKGIEYFTNIIYLGCDDNKLVTLDVSKNTALEQLSCINTNLTNLDVSKNTKLIAMWCYQNNLTSLDISKNMDLEELGCTNNPLLTNIYVWAGFDIASPNNSITNIYKDEHNNFIIK